MTYQLLTPEMRAKFLNLYADVFWFGILAGSSMAFLAVFAARQGASSMQISMLTAGPGVINLIFSLPVGSWLEGRSLFKITFWSSILHRVGYLVLVPLPWLLPASMQIWALGLIVAVSSIPGTLLAISFNAMFADVVPPEWRAHVVGRRNALLSISMTGSSILSGFMLDKFEFPGNYQIVFAIGALGAFLSSYHLSRVRDSREAPLRMWASLGDFARPGFLRFVDSFRQPIGLRFYSRSRSKPFFRLELLQSSFGIFLFALLVFYSAQYASIPLYPLFFVNDLHLTDGQISLGNALFYGSMLLGSLALGRISTRFGHHKVLMIGSLLYGSYPLFNYLAYNATLYWVASITGGVVWAITNAGLVNRLMERVPEGDRPAHMAFHNLVLNLGILSGSILGPLLAGWVGLRDSLLINTIMRLFAGILLSVFG